jgi:uncharacterized membrane protein
MFLNFNSILKKEVISQILLPAFIMIILDAIFITLNMRMFRNQVISVQRTDLTIKPMGAVLCYLVMIYALYHFIIRTNGSIWEAMRLGFVIFAVYETTSYALLKNWRLETVIVDTLWGTALFGLTTYFTYTLSRL